MINILQKPYTRQQYAEFALSANQAGKCVEINEEGDLVATEAPVILESRIEKIKAELSELDLKSIRALRGKSDKDIDRLAELEAGAEELRRQLTELE